ncbi:hypothetical protein Scep_012126 [Stephania cephalantha]|uniref:Uncharacterized protein n=1 Tax=Stephania cephalantha TaxID=152367 RepID=A0AAP0JEK9_9MAGN
MSDCCKNIDERPGFLLQEIWEGYLAHWSSSEYMAKSEQASKNRKSEKNGPGAGTSKHTGGTKSFASHKETLDEKAGELVSVNVLFNYIHTKGHNNVTFVDERSRKLNDYERRLEELM